MMDIGALITGALLLAAGSVLNLLMDAKRRRWATESERLTRREQRAEDAAGDLLEVLDELQRSFYAVSDLSDDHPNLSEKLGRVARLSAMIPDDEVRTRVEWAGEALGATYAVATYQGDHPRRTGYQATYAASKVVGAWLRGDAIPETPILAEYHAAVEEDHEVWAEHERQRALDRRKGNS